MWKFDFGSGPAEAGYTRVAPDTRYSKESSFGLQNGSPQSMERNGGTALRRSFLTSDKPFSFSIKVPEGNYKVSVLLGDAETASNTTIKAEARRLLLQSVQTAPGEWKTGTFTVNVRTPNIAGGSSVGINKREQDALNWDDKLTLEFNGVRSCVCAVEIEKITNARTVFIAGDSTVTDQANEPYAGWGQMLPRFFKPDVAVANYAESGRALYSFRSERRLSKILSVIQPGDYLFIQFGHNDQKDKSPGSGPFTTYKSNLKSYIEQARQKGALPVVVTPMERRRWDANGQTQQTLTDFAAAARQTAREENAPLIDLHAMSLKFYAAMGPEPSKKAFVHYPANTFPGQNEVLKDDTHFTAYGGYELAMCVVEGIKANVPELAKFLTDDIVPFDPAKPDSFESVNIPPSTLRGNEKPAGN